MSPRTIHCTTSLGARSAIDRWMQLFSLGGRPRVAATAGSPRFISAAAVRRLQAPSLKGKAVRESTARFIMVAGAKLVPRIRLNDLWPGGPDDCLEWLDQIAEPGNPVEHLAIVWSQSRVNSRVYVHLLQGSGRPVAFCKVFFGLDGQRCESAEATALDLVARGSYRSFAVPNLQRRFATTRSQTLVFNPLPEDTNAARPNPQRHPAIILDELQSTSTWCQLDELAQQLWWRQAGELGDAVAAFLAQDAENLSHACGFAHGDLSPANLLSSDDRLWLVDWEESSVLAPRRTDRLGAYLSFCGGVTRRRRIRAIRRNLVEDCSITQRRRAELLLALLYRHAHGHPEATVLLRYWRESLGSL
jgi:hypothetical protein